MGWTTIYITGKSDFREDVREKIESSPLDIMPGHTGAWSPAEHIHDLYWVDENLSLRDFKEAIGSKLIWKYRLRFYPTFEAFIEEQNKKHPSNSLTAEELALLEEIKSAGM
ncbi:MAG TPA: hypothetical protein VEB86_16160 [Chryseosolibacter sp.]|nr:hypothetical protein [Chryseosolibacter sp.]